ncbi:MAG: pilus assembly protein [Peptococcaceae bacterium]|nr:pilus assembly protein [Peptococcaceae bacterium]
MKLLNIKEDQQGQSIVELALVLPIFLLLFMGIVEFGIIFHNYLVITNASREGARIAIIGSSDLNITNRILSASTSLQPEKLQIKISPDSTQRKSGTLTTVEVSYHHNPIFPVLYNLAPDLLILTSKTTMQIE